MPKSQGPERRLTTQHWTFVFGHWSFPSCGGWNRTNIKAFRAPRPTVRRPRIKQPRHARLEKARGAGIEPTLPGSKPGGLPLADPRSEGVPCGSRTRLARLEAWNLCRSAKGT